MKHVLIAIAGLVGVLLMTSPAIAQQRGGSNPTRLFDPSTVTTVRGVVTRVDSVQASRGPSVGIHLQLQTAATTLPVHLGPAWYLADQSFTLQAGDSLMVRGSRVTMEDTPTLIAVELHRGDQSLRLRDDAGRPAWRAPRRQR